MYLSIKIQKDQLENIIRSKQKIDIFHIRGTEDCKNGVNIVLREIGLNKILVVRDLYFDDSKGTITFVLVSEENQTFFENVKKFNDYLKV